MAAVARGLEPPDPMNARVPCPLCGGLLHPIAGRCKHCKQDVSPHRARGGGPTGMLPQLAPFVGQPGAAAVALGPAPFPPDEARRGGWLRNWPLLVILLAVVGMIVALVLLVLPRGDSSVRRRGGAPLHNDPMETDRLPGSGRGKPGVDDPWNSPSPRAPGSSSTSPGSRGPRAPQDPSDPTSPLSPADPGPDVLGGVVPDVADPDFIDPDADPSDPDPGADPFGSTDPAAPDPLDPLAATIRSARPTRDNILALMAFHLCERAATCGNDPVNQQVCERMMTTLPLRPSNCFHPAKARQCLRMIDLLPCGRLPTTSRLPMIPVCEELMTC